MVVIQHPTANHHQSYQPINGGGPLMMEWRNGPFSSGGMPNEIAIFGGMRSGPFIKYVRKKMRIFDPPSLYVRRKTIENAPKNNRCTHSRANFYTIPPSHLTYVFNEWSRMKRRDFLAQKYPGRVAESCRIPRPNGRMGTQPIRKTIACVLSGLLN